MLYPFLQITTATITWGELIEFALKMVGFGLLLWGLFEFISKKANKKDVEEALAKKVDVTRYEDYKIQIQGELDRHDLLFEKLNERLNDDAAEREESREMLARIDERTAYIAKNCPKNKC